MPDPERAVRDELRRMPLAGYGEKQLEDFARYVFGVRYSVLKEVMDMLETEPDFATQ